jgi:hypothetical protein
MTSHGVLDREHGTGEPPGVGEPDACLNCGAELLGPYCAACGQKRPHLDLTLGEVLHEAAHELTHWEGKLPATLKALFLEPGALTRDFLAGRRARWLPPLRLYLICSVAFFLSKALVESVTHRPTYGGAKLSVTSSSGTGTLTPEERQAIARGLPGRVFGVERLERAAANRTQLNHAVDTAYPKAMFVILPFFALLTNLAWKRAQPRYPAHLYTALHLHAAWFGALTVSTLVMALFASDVARTLVGAAVIAYLVWYSLLTLHRVFGDSWPTTVAKTAAVGVAYFIGLIAASFLVLAYAVATM